MFDFCIFIGRFSPLHNAHRAILDKAFSISKNVIIIIGSASSPRTVRNPWSAAERINMITATLSDNEKDRTSLLTISDYTYNDNLWFSTLQQKISDITNGSNNIAIIGFESDESSAYLKSFPQYTYISCPTSHKFHATNIRDLYFSYDVNYKEMVPANVSMFLDTFTSTDAFSYLKKEKDYVDSYKESWRGAPFPPIFVTVDTLVVKSGHILVVERGHNPGKGLLALPGGFVNQKEKLQDAALRELKEETGIKISIPDLRKSIVDSKVFDDPMRSSRGRVLSHSFFIDLGTGALPKVKGNDDARDAYWLPLSDFQNMEEKFFEDHFHIIRNMIYKY